SYILSFIFLLSFILLFLIYFFFFFNDPATTEIYTLSLHDALPIWVSAGFQIKDAQGTRFAIKFDVPKYPELTTGAEVVATYLYWAAGYNVPDNVIVTFRREDLEIAPDAKYDDPLKGNIPMSEEFLDKVLAKAARNPDA